MTTTINTNGINTNYPVPGENNSTQGFRDNFASIKTNLNTAGAEITDLQSKVVLKSALDGAILNNDMANTIISNAATKGFRGTTFNLGNALTGPVVINVAQADVHYGNIAGNISLQFASWAPTNTESCVTLRLGFDPAATTSVITFPGEVVVSNNNFGGTLLENYATNIGGNLTITAPYGVEQLEFELRTLDCGSTITIQPINRPYKATQLVNRTPSPTGFPGDKLGTAVVDEDYLYICTADYDANTITSINGISTNATGNLITFSADVAGAGVAADMPVIFDTMKISNVSVTDFGNIISGQVYYVKAIVGSTITISDTRTAGTAGAEFALTTVSAGVNTSMDATFYDGTDIWKRITLGTW
jgi:hypothetical protein